MPAVVDLKESSPVSAVADDVSPGVGVGSARLLRSNRRQELRVEPVAVGGSGDFGSVGDALRGQARCRRIDSHSTRHIPPTPVFDKERWGF
jgi:hypothetical protein